MCRLRSCDTDAMRPAACAMTGFSRRRLREGGRVGEPSVLREHDPEARTRQAARGRRTQTARYLVTVEHVGFHVSRGSRQAPRERRVETRLATQRGDQRPGGLERLAPRPNGIEATHSLPRLAPKSLDQFEHKPFGAARD